MSLWCLRRSGSPKSRKFAKLICGKPKSAEELVEAEAEAAWQRVLQHVNRWHPDIGSLKGQIRLTRRETIALNACGGLYNLWAEQDQGPGLPFMHRDFVRVFKLSDRVEEVLDRPRLPSSSAPMVSAGDILAKLQIGIKKSETEVVAVGGAL